jgi:hypothetical protein
MPAARSQQIKVVPVDDAAFAEIYGGCYVARVGDWESEKRSTPDRARHDADEYLAALADDE